MTNLALLFLKKLTNTYDFLFVLGVLSVFFIQFVINVGMNLGLLPVTGIPLPMFSYGGTSMIVSLAMLGMVQGILVHQNSSN